MGGCIEADGCCLNCGWGRTRQSLSECGCMVYLVRVTADGSVGPVLPDYEG